MLIIVLVIVNLLPTCGLNKGEHGNFYFRDKSVKFLSLIENYNQLHKDIISGARPPKYIIYQPNSQVQT